VGDRASKPGGCLDRAALIGLAFALVACIALAFTGRGDAAKLIGTLIVIAVGTGLVRGSLRLREPAAWRVVGWIGAAATASGSLCALALIWRPDLMSGGASDSYAIMRLSIALSTAGALVADLGRLRSFELRRLVDRLVRATAWLTAGTLAALVIVTCAQATPDAWLGSIFGFGTWPFWVGFGICLTFSHLAVPILGRMEERRERARLESATDRATLTLQCPRCLLWVQMHSGRILCPGCSLQLRIEFEEPRCGCGYPLHRLSGPNCPECGFEVPPERRWGAARATAAQAASGAQSPSMPSA